MKKHLSLFLAFSFIVSLAGFQIARAGGTVLGFIPQNSLYFFRISTTENNPLEHKIEDYLNQIFYHDESIKLFDERTLVNVFTVGQTVSPDDSKMLSTYYVFYMPSADFDAYLQNIPAGLLTSQQEGAYKYYTLGKIYFAVSSFINDQTVIRVADNKKELFSLLDLDNNTSNSMYDKPDTSNLETGFFEGYFNIDTLRAFDSANPLLAPGIKSGNFSVTLASNLDSNLGSNNLDNNSLEGDSKFYENNPTDTAQQKITFNPSFLTNFDLSQLVLYPSDTAPSQNLDKVLHFLTGSESASVNAMDGSYEVTFTQPFNRAASFGCSVLPSYNINNLFQKPLSIEFKDVNKFEPYYPYIQTMLQQGIMEGYAMPDGRYFRPNDTITRAEFTKLALAVQVKKSQSYGDIGPQLYFHDVSPCEWFAPYINKAYTFNFIQGYKDGTFRPHSPMSQAEALQLLYNAVYDLQKPELQQGDLPYQDVQPQDWFYKAIKAAYNQGLLTKKSAFFFPKQSFTRSQAATMLSFLFSAK